MNTVLQISRKMSISIANLSKKHGMLSIEYKQDRTKHLRNGKYWDTAECTSLKTRRTFIVNHYGEIFEDEKPCYIRKAYNKPTVKIGQFATV